VAAPLSEFCLLDIGYAKVLLPKAQALKAFDALNDGELVEYDYATKGYKPSTGHTEGVTKLTSFSVAQLAVLELNRETTKDS